MGIIKVKHSLGHVEYTSDELKKDLDDLEFLRDAFLVLLNEDETAKSDIPYSKEDAIKYAKEMYINSNYSNEFIEKCFK